MYPLHTLGKWYEFFPNRVLLNTGFFEVEGLGDWPHIMPCTNVYGELVSNHRFLPSMRSKKLPFDYLVIKPDKDRIFKNHIDFIRNPLLILKRWKPLLESSLQT